eukprot:TRINITY_DN5218_c0_g1_i2.p1 TRINITY_DN5218_c0_g1~~TRINITY_DN5218_c0_g1_i2.p1  ORF type:complete len:330 (-),score=86.76 TRINITY_DN5218_c0_g1_i2:102-1091(-)
MTMATNGAAGRTLEEMRSGLGISNLQQENEVNSKKIHAFNSSQDVELSVANSMWVSHNLKIEKSFVDAMKQNYQAEVAPLTTVEAINGWCKTKTKEKIPEIIQVLDPLAGLILLNAVYFKGLFTEKFDKGLTKSDQNFFCSDGSSSKCNMMHQNGKFDYFENSEVQAVRKGYGSGDEFCCVVVLPRSEINIDTFVSSLTNQKWSSITSSLSSSPGQLFLPRFKLKWNKDLSPELKDLGMGTAFSKGGADFSKIGKPDLFISSVIHSSVVEVNEEGTEAAAATAVVMKFKKKERKVNPFVMRVDRPFLFLIQNVQSGDILFMGKIETVEE